MRAGYEDIVFVYKAIHCIQVFSFITDRFQAIYEMQEESYIAVDDDDEEED